MLSTIAIGFIGGLITGISPCILPILPLVLAVSQGSKARPWLVIGGLVTSFTVVTLFATTLLNALGLPADILWKLGIALLVLVGLGMIFPKLQEYWNGHSSSCRGHISCRPAPAIRAGLPSAWPWVWFLYRALAQYWRQSPWLVLQAKSMPASPFSASRSRLA